MPPKNKQTTSSTKKSTRLVKSAIYRPKRSDSSKFIDKSVSKKSSRKGIPKKHQKDYLSLGDHLEELRWRLISVVFTIIGLSILSFIFSSHIHSFLIEPYLNLSSEKLLLQNVYGSIEVLIKISITLGISLSLPICLSLLWRFVTPALSSRIAWLGHLAMASSACLFWAGMAVAWFYIFPLALKFLFEDTLIRGVSPQTTVEKYYSFLFLLHIGSGLMFQMPLIVIFLGWIGILSVEWHKRKWKFLVLVVLILTAVLTPPDPLSQIILSGLLLFLYICSVFIVWLIEKTKYPKP